MMIKDGDRKDCVFLLRRKLKIDHHLNFFSSPSCRFPQKTHTKEEICCSLLPYQQISSQKGEVLPCFFVEFKFHSPQRQFVTSF